jgi:hypothetical protein
MQARQRHASAQRNNRAQDKQPGKVAQWKIAQGDMRAGQFGLQAMPPDDPKIYFAPDGEIFESREIWRGIVSRVREEGDKMPTLTAHSQPAESDSDMGLRTSDDEAKWSHRSDNTAPAGDETLDRSKEFNPAEILPQGVALPPDWPPVNAPRVARRVFDYGGEPIVIVINGLPYTAAALARKRQREGALLAMSCASAATTKPEPDY